MEKSRLRVLDVEGSIGVITRPIQEKAREIKNWKEDWHRLSWMLLLPAHIPESHILKGIYTPPPGVPNYPSYGALMAHSLANNINK